MLRLPSYRCSRRVALAVVAMTLSAIGVPVLGSVGAAGALTGDVAYPLGLCQANLVAVSTSNDQPARGTIALSLGGAPATADECFADGYTNSGVAVTTGDSASSSITAVAINSCYSVGDYASLVGGGITQCGRGFLANVSVFGDAYGGQPGSLFSFSLLGDASGSFLAIAPVGSAYGNTAVGCQAAYGSSDVWWRWCSAWESALTPSQQQAVYGTLQVLGQVGLAETQAVLNYYNSNISALSTVVATAAPFTGCENHGGVHGAFVGPGAGTIQTDLWCNDGYRVVYAYVYTLTSAKRLISCQVETIGTKLVGDGRDAESAIGAVTCSEPVHADWSMGFNVRTAIGTQFVACQDSEPYAQNGYYGTNPMPRRTCRTRMGTGRNSTTHYLRLTAASDGTQVTIVNKDPSFYIDCPEGSGPCSQPEQA